MRSTCRSSNAYGGGCVSSSRCIAKVAIPSLRAAHAGRSRPTRGDDPVDRQPRAQSRPRQRHDPARAWPHRDPRPARAGSPRRADRRPRCVASARSLRKDRSPDTLSWRETSAGPGPARSARSTVATARLGGGSDAWETRRHGVPPRDPRAVDTRRTGVLRLPDGVIGRGDVLVALEARISRACPSRAGGSCSSKATSGVGKSTVLREMRRRVSATGGLVAAG